MAARTIMVASALFSGLAATTAATADFGISFSFSTYRPACYATSVSHCYTTYAPASYVWYDYPWGCYAPVTCVEYVPPPVVVYDTWYPASYCTTYTRSTCYTAPAPAVGFGVYYRSGSGVHHERRVVHRSSYAHRSSYVAPSSRHVYKRSLVPHHGDSEVRYRYRGVRERYASPYRRVYHD